MIEFHAHQIEFSLQKQESVRNWLLLLLEDYGFKAQSLTYVFVSDEFLLNINQTHLGHDYYTDIITFPYHEDQDPLHADLYISIDRVSENAKTLGVSFEDELHRVMVHGLLHLMGYDDHNEDDQRKMREAEDSALSMRT